MFIHRLNFILKTLSARFIVCAAAKCMIELIYTTMHKALRGIYVNDELKDKEGTGDILEQWFRLIG